MANIANVCFCIPDSISLRPVKESAAENPTCNQKREINNKKNLLFLILICNNRTVCDIILINLIKRIILSKVIKWF